MKPRPGARRAFPNRILTMKHTLAACLSLLALNLAALADDAPERPFNGSDLSGWKFKCDAKKSKWVVGRARLDDTAAPKVNASKKPGEWQKFVIEFQTPKFEGEKKVANARFIKVTLNDQVIHEDVEAKGPTPSCLTGKESTSGPVMFQGDHGPVACRNLTIKPSKN